MSIDQCDKIISFSADEDEFTIGLDGNELN